MFGFFHWNPYLKTGNDFLKKICRNFYIIFPRNVSSHNVCIALGKNKMQKIKIHDINTEK